MTDRFPLVEPYDSGLLDVGDGHRIYWEACGNPAGTPAVYLHGGPGSGASPGQRRYFDPDAYRVVLFDQRGAGRSRPSARQPDADLNANTTGHLISDIEALRELHGIERWVVLGISWGTTLGLAYAQAHPERVSALVLALITATTRCEVQWMTRDLRRVHPEAWNRFVSAVPASMRDLPLADVYATLLFDPDPIVRERAALEWCLWDNAQMGRASMPARFDDPDFRLRIARLVTHYWRNGAFLDEDQLLREAPKLNGIPGVLIHGRNDISCPLDTAWHLSRAWTTSELIVVDSGHGGGTAFSSAVVDALNRFR
jgi:proline iminopeptidase